MSYDDTWGTQQKDPKGSIPETWRHGPGPLYQSGLLDGHCICMGVHGFIPITVEIMA